MPAIQLTPSERKDKRADAHHLAPVVLIGGDGLTPAVVKETDAALNAHGLIKVRVFSDQRETRDAMFAALADRLNAAPIQHIGKLLVLWRPMPEKVKSERDDRMPGPKMVKVLKFSKSGNHRPQVKKIKVLGNQRIAAGGQIKRAKKRITSVKKTAVD
ncbi:YhbY family RNA-binding protein [Piscinibacter sp.]|jgi:RNA-binding protein|uniref:YhbY family RNA-binding protein n=1 Tax=Piscinibacter sp. TaxID=1903157 RepID=UPI00355A1979